MAGLDSGTIGFLVFLGIAVGFAVGSIVLNWVFGARRRYSYLQRTTYECGQEPEGEAQIDFPSAHYVYALVFVAVDILGFVLVLWAVSFRAFRTAWPTFAAILGGFTLLALAGIYYVLRGERSLWV
ncbi:MAG: NADH-quinone oxidoreductase subunit A [Euryarchaeota archaeon]|nr:NADH-quinone oxidoreductase subunit A [Euryarchaeota archaeon]MDE1835205.1 NADH-quinone oxidoreductase subunit A [Euryarchaeota archaeon]MDE1880062.1 NADH-quinone oxidoreductase subunit A [Euryarchaeota archaeon]MDE2043501.1 NADH-quinone oxidoreductase subunit A [Thermoplasmata archaeon]